MIRQSKVAPARSSTSGVHKRSLKPQRAVSPVTKTCAYSARNCSQPVLEKYSYCARHILEDKDAPYKPCGYAYPSNNKRCLLPAPRANDKRDAGYCTLHVLKTQLKRHGPSSKHVPPVTPESVLAGLSHYVRPVKSAAKAENDELHSTNRTINNPINPFVEADLARAASHRSAVLECASDSDSDVEMSTMDNVWGGDNEDSSDAESVESQMDDNLKHAGAYTLEEVATIHHRKLMRLQLLYQRQFERLAHLLKEKRRKYLIALKKEKETLASITDQAKTSAKDMKQFEKLKALNRYQKRSAAESVAYLSQLEKRQKDLAKPPSYTKCFYSEGGVRCSKSTIPLTRYCFKHILEDPNQCLFRACGCEKADTICQDTVTGLCSGETCILHVKLPPLPHINTTSEDPSRPEEVEESKRERQPQPLCLSLDPVSVSGTIQSQPEFHSIRMDVTVVDQEADANNMEESEFDASATESAVSNENRDSPDDGIGCDETRDQHLLHRRLSLKSDFPDDFRSGGAGGQPSGLQDDFEVEAPRSPTSHH